jgi:hypothetical protein
MSDLMLFDIFIGVVFFLSIWYAYACGMVDISSHRARKNRNFKKIIDEFEHSEQDKGKDVS